MLDALEPSFPLRHGNPASWRGVGPEERRRIEGLALEDARRTIIDVNEKARVEAEIAAARAAAAEPIPNIAELAEIVVRNPGAIPAMRARVEDCWSSVRSLPNAPVRQLDHSSEAFRSVQLHHPAQAVVLQECYWQLKYLNEMSARRDEFATLSWQAGEATAGGAAMAYHPGKLIARLAGRGCFLALNPAGKLAVTGAGALNATDRDEIAINRQEIIAALSATEEV